MENPARFLNHHGSLEYSGGKMDTVQTDENEWNNGVNQAGEDAIVTIGIEFPDRTRGGLAMAGE